MEPLPLRLSIYAHRLIEMHPHAIPRRLHHHAGALGGEDDVIALADIHESTLKMQKC
jgi:hypothetical protein